MEWIGSNPDCGLIAERAEFLEEKGRLTEDIRALNARLGQSASDGRPIAVWSSDVIEISSATKTSD
jgi:hypothetical protein